MRFKLVLLLIAAVALPLLSDSYVLYLANVTLSYVVVSAGLNILLGYSGQFAFANAAFMGLGAYTTAVLATRWGVPVLLCIPVAAALTGVLGCVFSLPVMRLKNVYLAMVTLAFAELMQWIFIHWKTVTAGTDGLSIPVPHLFDWHLSDDRAAYVVVIAVVAIVMFLAERLMRSKIGRAFLAIKENEIVAQCNGIDVARYKALAFALSACMAGIGGSLFALSVRYIIPDGFGLLQLVLQFSIVVIGGLGSLLGSTIGAIVLTLLPEILRDAAAIQEILYGVILLVVVIFTPRGIAGLLYARGLLRRKPLIAANLRDEGQQ